MEMIMIGIGIGILALFALLSIIAIIRGRPRTGEEIIEEIETLGADGEEPFDFEEREVHCPVCGEEVDPFDEECDHCGAIFEKDIFECPSCGEDVNPREPICGSCGEIIQTEATTCPHCGGVVSPDSKHCDSCGEDFWSPVKLEAKLPRPKKKFEAEVDLEE